MTEIGNRNSEVSRWSWSVGRDALSLCAMLFALDSPAAAQAQAKLSKIGWLQVTASSSSRIELFREALREIGYVEGKNITIVVRCANGDSSRLPAIQQELIALRVDVR